MRSLVRIVKVDEVLVHPNADKLEIAVVGGWQCVVKKDEFKKGDWGVYHEIDSWLPASFEPYAFLNKGKKFNDVEGSKLRTIRLRQSMSQGLLLPLNILDGVDLSLSLGVQKWEKELPACLAGKVKGNFPSFMPKTEESRLQNLRREFQQWLENGVEFDVQEKADGSSLSIALKDGDFKVCSRNLDLERDEENAFWKAAITLNVEEKLRNLGRNIALQGELIAYTIQGNPYNLSVGEYQYRLFNVFDIDKQQYVTSDEMYELANILDLQSVPFIGTFKLSDIVGDNVDEDVTTKMQKLLKFADGWSNINSEGRGQSRREGLVFKSRLNPTDDHFKVISNAWLENEEE